MPHTLYLAPCTSYLVPDTFHLLPCASCLTPCTLYAPLVCRFNQPILILGSEAHRIISLDETNFTFDGTDQEGVDILVPTEEAESDVVIQVMVPKSSLKCTIVGGSDASGDSLPAYLVFKNSFDMEAVRGFPKPSKLGPDGNFMSARSVANDSGGMTNDEALRYLTGHLLPFCHDATPEKPYVLILDGHGSHVTGPFLKLCKASNIIVVVRVPHTTHLTQGEDVVRHAASPRPFLCARTQRCAH